MGSSAIQIAAAKQESYLWPYSDLRLPRWQPVPGQQAHAMEMPESVEELAVDSRWPAFFPSPICLVTTSDGRHTALEKCVGASIVNRFPYVVALSFCKDELSLRHYPRTRFMELLERGGCAAIQYLAPGPAIGRAMKVIQAVPDALCHSRLAATGLDITAAHTNQAPVFSDAYMVYEARLAKPARDIEGYPIYQTPWLDVGSHRVYFLEITAIQLRQDIAAGDAQISWRGLPAWTPLGKMQTPPARRDDDLPHGYTKAYTPHYAFPSSGTIAFAADVIANGMAVKFLPPLAEDQVEVDNDRARWPCFFPSSLGMITTETDGRPNLMPCGSTTVLSRHPMTIAPCISYRAINERYAPRTTLDAIRKTNRFGCGVPYINDTIVSAIRYAGNVSFSRDRNKVANAGLEVLNHRSAPLLPALPIHYDCEVTGEVRLGTHVMFLGEVRRIQVRDDVHRNNPLEWYPWAGISPSGAAGNT